MSELAIYSPPKLKEPSELYETTDVGLLGGLFAERNKKKALIEKVSGVFNNPNLTSVVRHFIDGNVEYDRRWAARSHADKIFQKGGAISSLDSDYWQKAINLTDVYSVMPQKRREEWQENIKINKVPEFEENVVISTLKDLLSSRQKFLSERVDGIFKGLSGHHVTNSPFGFNKRMIMNYVVEPDWGMPRHEKCGLIDDLRSVIGKFTGRGNVPAGMTYSLLSRLYKDTGTWYEVDGGALRLKVYKKGTAHMEIHPDIAWRLNAILATLYPAAIPSSERKAPRSRVNIEPMKETISWELIKTIGEMGSYKGDNCLSFKHASCSGYVKSQIIDLFARLGGVFDSNDIVFPYPIEGVRAHLLDTGTLPDTKSHQYYPTPEMLAYLAVEMAEIEESHKCLEPSAGTGNLADLMPKDTLCVEYSDLHCKVLESKGFKALNGDFLKYAEDAVERFDRIVMNPPFTKNQALIHLKAAADLLKDNGRLVGIMPASLKGKSLFAGFNFEWSETFENKFEGTGVIVSIVTVERA